MKKNGVKEAKEKRGEIKKEEKEARMRRVETKKKKYGKRGKETKGEKKEGEEKLRRKLAMLEIKKNLWRSYREDGKFIKLEDYFVHQALHPCLY